MRSVRHRMPDRSRSNIGWLITFNDMITLLMVFFVLVFATGTIDVRKVKHFQSSMQSALGVLLEGRKTGVEVMEEEQAAGLSDQRRETPTDQGAVDQEGTVEGGRGRVPTPSELMQSLVEALDNEHGIDAVYTSKGVLITLDDRLLFELGRAEISPQGLPVLEKVLTLLQKAAKPVRVEGHTDNLPINTRQYPSNWELSTARAVNVVKYFIEQGRLDPHRLSAVGYGEAKPRVTNDTPAHRARNRRVEIVLELQEGK